MKKQLLSTLALSMAMFAMAQTTPTVAWGNLIDGGTSAGDNSNGICSDASGNVYWMGNYGSTKTTPQIDYAGEPLFSGAEYDAANSYNANLTVLKTDATGKKVWVVYSNSGEFANCGGIANTADGGVVVASKVRHTDGMLDRDINIVDATGKSTTVAWTCEQRYYRLMVTKLSAEGAVEWNRMLDFSTKPAGDAEGFWSDCFNLGNIATDDEGNIYLPLNYRNTLTVAKADNTTATLTPNNIKTWGGDSQTSCGDFLLLSLDKDGYYRDALTLDGSATSAYAQYVIYAGGKLYVQGYIIGDGSDVTLQGNTFKPTDVLSPVVMAVGTDYKVDWAKCFPGEKVDGKNGVNNFALSLIGDKLYLAGGMNLKFSDSTDSSKFIATKNGNPREGIIVLLNAADGAWLASRGSLDDEWGTTKLTCYLSVIPSADDNMVYAIGYTMDATVGVYARGYNATSLEGDTKTKYDLVTGGGAPTLQTASYVDGTLYLAVRGNKEFEMLGLGKSAATNKWGILATKVNVPAPVSSVADITVDDDAAVEYYNLQGMRVANPQGGVFIRRQGAKVAKVVK